MSIHPLRTKAHSESRPRAQEVESHFPETPSTLSFSHNKPLHRLSPIFTVSRLKDPRTKPWWHPKSKGNLCRTTPDASPDLSRGQMTCPQNQRFLQSNILSVQKLLDRILALPVENKKKTRKNEELTGAQSNDCGALCLWGRHRPTLPSAGLPH